MTDKIKQLLEIKIGNYQLKGHYNPQISAQYAVDSVLSMIKNSSPENQLAMLNMEIEDALASRKNLTNA